MEKEGITSTEGERCCEKTGEGRVAGLGQVYQGEQQHSRRYRFLFVWISGHST